jgi:hypothetical protein
MRQREGTRQGDNSLKSDNPPAIFMKTKRKSYNQRAKRKNARLRDNNKKRRSVFTWTRIPWGKEKREYHIFDDKTGDYISNMWSDTPKTQNIKYAHKFVDIDTIIRVINQLKHTGAWRTIRIK